VAWQLAQGDGLNAAQAGQRKTLRVERCVAIRVGHTCGFQALEIKQAVV